MNTHNVVGEGLSRRNAPIIYFKLWPKCRPTDSLLQQYDYDIIICPQGVVVPPCWTLPKGYIVEPRDGHPKCPRDSTGCLKKNAMAIQQPVVHHKLS